jgi:hypothetical protein
MKLAILGFTLILSIRSLLYGPLDKPVVGQLSLLTISGFVLLFFSGIGMIGVLSELIKKRN